MKGFTSLLIVIIVNAVLIQARGNKTENEGSGSIPKCPPRKHWNAKQEACICRREFKCYPADSTYDPETCTFSTCVKKDCESGKKFDKKECSCICENPIPSVIQANKHWNPNTCAVECINPMPAGGCPGKQVWSGDSCSCRCDSSVPALCPGLQTWNDLTCSCGCPNKMPTTIQTNKRWNPNNCAVECNQSCTSPKSIDTNTCECKCANKPAVIHATESWYWDESKCKMACNLPMPVYGCREGQIYDTDICACQCPKTIKCKSSRQYFSPKRGCKCVDRCTEPKPAAGCPMGKTWCTDICKCECVEKQPRLGCGSNKVWNSDTCKCEQLK